MGMRFRKSIKLAPGVKLNVGKKSMGVSFGSKYGGVSVNSRTGVRGRVSIPGTGISFSKNASIKRERTSTNTSVRASVNTPPVEPCSIEYDEKVVCSLNDAAFNHYLLGYSAYAKTVSVDDPRSETVEKQIAILQKEQIRRLDAEKEKEKKRNEPSLLLVSCGIFCGVCGLLMMISSLWGLVFVVLGVLILLAEYSKK